MAQVAHNDTPSTSAAPTEPALPVDQQPLPSLPHRHLDAPRYLDRRRSQQQFLAHPRTDREGVTDSTIPASVSDVHPPATRSVSLRDSVSVPSSQSTDTLSHSYALAVSSSLSSHPTHPDRAGVVDTSDPHLAVRASSAIDGVAATKAVTATTVTSAIPSTSGTTIAANTMPATTTSPHSPHLADPTQSTPTAVMPMVNAFADMSLAPPHMHYPTPMPIMPIQPQPLVPLVPPHHHPAGPHLPHGARHSAHHAGTPHLMHNQRTTVCHWVPQERVGAVIGGHGNVIRSLQEKSGATIQVHNDTVRAEHKLFTVYGLPAQIETAIQLILDIVERPRGSSSGSERTAHHSLRETISQPPDLCKTIFVPSSCVGLVIGRNGETIRNLQDRSGAEIKVTPDEEAPRGHVNRSILISGNEDAIATAHQLVSQIVSDARRRHSHPGPLNTTPNGEPVLMEVFSVPNEKVGLIIGKKGVAIRDLQLRSGAKIQVTKDDSSVRDGSRPVTITGSRSQVEEAKNLIALKINMQYLPPSSAPPQFSPPPSTPPAVVATAPQATPIPLPNPGTPQSVPYGFPPMYESEYANGQPSSLQPVFDTNDPNAQQRGPTMTYFPYLGFNNYAAMSQHHRQFSPTMPPPHMQYAAQAQVGQPQTPQTLQQAQPGGIHLPPTHHFQGEQMGTSEGVSTSVSSFSHGPPTAGPHAPLPNGDSDGGEGPDLGDRSMTNSTGALPASMSLGGTPSPGMGGGGSRDGGGPAMLMFAGHAFPQMHGMAAPQQVYPAGGPTGAGSQSQRIFHGAEGSHAQQLIGVTQGQQSQSQSQLPPGTRPGARGNGGPIGGDGEERSREVVGESSTSGRVAGSGEG